MKPKHYLIGGWLVLLAVAFAPTFTNNPPNYNKRTQTLTFEEVSPSTSSSLPLPLDSWSGFWLPLDSDFSSITSTTVETLTTQPTISIPSTTTTLIPETTTTTVLTSGESITPTQETLSVIQIAQMSLGKSKTELGFSNFWCAEAYRYWVGHPDLSDSPGQMSLQLEATNSPMPGDAVFIDLIPEMETGQITHVALFVSFNDDGSVKTIEGNGQSRDFITEGVRYPNEIISFGKAP